METFDTFDIAHAYLSTLGVCDSPGGAEYTHVRLEWESYPDGQRPDPIPFITDRANAFYWSGYEIPRAVMPDEEFRASPDFSWIVVSVGV